MIELNLLPDIKSDFIKAQRTRRLIITVAILVAAASIVLLLGTLSVDGLQKKHISDLSDDITSLTTKLQAKPQINKILTVQNQLESLTALHAGKPAASRLFNYLNQVTPASVSITSLNIDFTQQTVTVTGVTDALSSVNKYIDTLKFTTYSVGGDSTQTKAFSNVVLGSFGVSTGAKDTTQAASYTITLSYDENIFNIIQDTKLNVPSLVTTRAQADQPTDLFKAAPATTTKGGN